MKKQLCSILIVFLCLLCLSSCSESAKFESYVKNGDYAEAIEYYNSEIYGNTKSEAAASTFLSTYLNEQYDAYAEGSLSDTDFQAALDTVSNINDSCVIFSSDEVDTIWQQYWELSNSRDCYEQGVQAMEEEDYPSAIDYLQYVSSIDTLNYEDAQSKLEEAAASYAEQITEQVNQKINDGISQREETLFSEADDLIGTASYYLDEATIDELYTLLYTSYYEFEFDYYYEEQVYDGALSVYEEGANSGYVTWSAEVTQKAAECKTAYRKDIIDRATEAYQADGYESAIQIISEGLAYLPDDEKLTEYYERFHACIPTPLNELTLLEGEDYYSDSSVEDIYGNRYQGYFDFYERDYDASATYYLGGEYTTFSGTYFGDEDIDSDVSVRFKVYADDVLIYDSDFFQRDQKAVDFSLDVSNVERLTIFSTGNDVYYSWGMMFYPKAILTNAYVSSEFSSSGLG